MPGFARVAGDYQGRVTFVAVDIGPFVGLGSHDDGVRQLQRTGTTYPAAYAVDRSALTRYGVLDTPTSIYFDRDGRVVRKVSSAFEESALRQQVAALAAS
jgi:thiol-disulfide isomerase/thioredoxin